MPNDTQVKSSTTSTSGSMPTATLIPFNQSVPFTGFPTVMEQKVITAPLTLTAIATGALPGASVLMRFVADGVMLNAPKFVGFTQATGSSGWDNTAGMVNLVQFQYDGVTFWFNVVQAAGGSLTDLQPPARLTSVVNSAGNTVVITFNEDLLLTSVPLASEFTGATVTAVSVAGKTVTLTLNPAKTTGATFGLAYAGSSIRDLAGNPSPGFTDSLTVAAAEPVPIPVALQSRDAGFNEVSVGTYSTVGGAWLGGVSNTLKFVDDSILETTNTTLAPTQGIIGLHASALTIGAVGSYQGIHTGLAYYGGNLNALHSGGQTNLGGHVAGDLIRIKRTGGVFLGQRKRGTGAWTTVHTFAVALSAPMSVVMILNDPNNQMSMGVY